MFSGSLAVRSRSDTQRHCLVFTGAFCLVALFFEFAQATDGFAKSHQKGTPTAVIRRQLHKS